LGESKFKPKTLQPMLK